MKSLKLANGDLMPALGLGTWKSRPNEVFDAVLHALKTGYRHIDCAQIYKNESEIGKALHKALSEGWVKREELWITSKLWNDSHLSADVRPAMERTLRDLQLDYVDLYLVHWPVAIKKGVDFPSGSGDFLSYEQAPLPETWKAMEALWDQKLARHIGVSNFHTKKLQEIQKNARIQPEVNQVELHPYLPQERLKTFCDQNGILLTGYGPLGAAYRVANSEVDHPLLLEDTDLKKIARKHGATVAQVVLAWALERGTSVVPKSVNPLRIEENFAALKVKLDAADMQVIKALKGPFRYTPGPAWVENGSPYAYSDLWEEFI
ncbi:alcohol dehydrogenase (NADP+) [Cyclobacterium lianum]|uniref:Alcohol dehydrogenase (NADP+) n=1 Tax=Cyclobacterium lianum TaxID=388280 RepID=A0A1M7NWP9_9BACT|nr:aldo/keto reductase [Cyclobacterium lianum]SHN08043.1 alcohol dehydrogenase (NADP+) [Cyclobacterium lianum]